MPSRFDPALHLPKRLQQRLDAWEANPPKHQHQAYGPLNAYLQGHKFTSDLFLVKPQKLLREESAVNGNGNEEEEEDRQQADEEDEQEEDEQADEDDEGDQSFDSIDSHGVAVMKGGGKKYPDFHVDQYWGADSDDNDHGDIVRIIIEIGSLGADQQQVTRQLTEYMDLAGSRCHGRLLGIGIIGNEARFLHKVGHSMIKDVYSYNEWISLFDPRFVQTLDDMEQYCRDNDHWPA